MTFNQTKLANERVLVSGKDKHDKDGEVILSATEWLNVQAQRQLKVAQDQYDEASKDFYATLTEAAEKLNQVHANRCADTDPNSYFEIEPAVAGTPGSQGVAIHLSHDSQVLRLLSEGKHERLVWVAGTLEITAP